MTHTVEEAKKLWCPMARVGQAGVVDIPVAYNRTITRHPTEVMVQAEGEEPKAIHALAGKIEVSAVANCISYQCAAWRWANSFMSEGFCGMAGKP
jgi:hypothetical protein